MLAEFGALTIDARADWAPYDHPAILALKLIKKTEFLNECAKNSGLRDTKERSGESRV